MAILENWSPGFNLGVEEIPFFHPLFVEGEKGVKPKKVPLCRKRKGHGIRATAYLLYMSLENWSPGFSLGSVLSRLKPVHWQRLTIQDLRSRVNQTSFSPSAVWKGLFFHHIFAVGENVVEKEDKVPLCRRRKGELTRPPRKS